MVKFMVISENVGDPHYVMAHLTDHLDFLQSLRNRDVLQIAGPFVEKDGSMLDGMYVVEAATVADAEKIASEDPLHKSGARSHRVRQWEDHTNFLSELRDHWLPMIEALMTKNSK